MSRSHKDGKVHLKQSVFFVAAAELSLRVLEVAALNVTARSSTTASRASPNLSFVDLLVEVASSTSPDLQRDPWCLRDLFGESLHHLLFPSLKLLLDLGGVLSNPVTRMQPTHLGCLLSPSVPQSLAAVEGGYLYLTTLGAEGPCLVGTLRVC